MKKTKRLFTGLILLLSGLGALQAAECPSKLMEGSVCLPKGFPVESTPGGYAVNLTHGHTKLSHDVYDLHMLILMICVVVGVLVFGVMFYSIYHHRKSKGHTAAQFHENTKIEFLWTIIPALILFAMAFPATKTMMEMDDSKEYEMTIKVTGWQWKWEYEYLNSGIHFFSNLDHSSNMARKLDSKTDARSVSHYLLSVDEPLVIPVKKKIRLVFTAADVIHSWWVPDLGWKKDAIPGFINEAWTSVNDPGIYRGQCTELCGKDHAFMPVVVIAMEQDDYDAWEKCKKDGCGGDNVDEAAEQPHDKLVSSGAQVYASSCATCHMENGEGIPGAFPALTGSKVVNGDINAQANLILNGRNAMPAFGKQLKAAELAQVITFTRNALGNSKGDEIQPKAIKVLLGGGSPVATEAAKDSGEVDKQPVSVKKSDAEQKLAEPVEKSKGDESSKALSKASSIDAKAEEVDNVQFAQDKFYPAKKFTDKKDDESGKLSSQADSKSSDKSDSSLAELKAHGARIYEKNCQSCHQKDGVGMPPVFPALKGSAIVVGDINKQVELMLKGKGAMPALSKTLNAKDFAAVLAYTRNGLGGNATGDFKKPSEIQALQ